MSKFKNLQDYQKRVKTNREIQAAALKQKLNVTWEKINHKNGWPTDNSFEQMKANGLYVDPLAKWPIGTLLGRRGRRI